MVTIFAMVGYTKDLPQQRAKLYEDAIEILLSEKPYKPDEYASELALDSGTCRDRLMRIAFELQEKRVDSLEVGDLVALIWQRFDSDVEKGSKAAQHFLQAVADRGGVLEEQDGRYGFFTHATFREYLRAVFGENRFLRRSNDGCSCCTLEDDQWDETIQLAAGYKDVEGEIGATIHPAVGEPGETDAQRARCPHPGWELAGGHGAPETLP